MNSRVGRLGGHSHDSRNLTFLFRSREATTHRVYLNEVDTPQTGIREPLNSPIPHPGPARLCARPSTDHERHLTKSSNHSIAGEPASSAGSRRTPSQRVRGGLSNCVSILRFRKSARACKGDPQTLRAVHPQSDPEGHEGNAVRIKHLEAGAAAPRLEYVTAVSGLAGDRELRLLNQDRQKINRLLTHF